MEFQEVDGSFAAGTVMPLTWDPKTPLPTPSHFEPEGVGSGTERTPMFEPSDFGDDDGDELKTVLNTSAYDLKPRFTGR